MASEIGIAVVRLDGIENRSRLRGFAWLADELLGGALKGYVILDRDYRMPELLGAMTNDLGEKGLAVHIWRRKEVESYLLHSAALSRISGASQRVVEDLLDSIVGTLKPYVAAQYVAVAQANRDKSQDASVAAQQALEYLDEEWQDGERRLSLCPARKVLSALNNQLQPEGFSHVSPKRLARNLLLEEIPIEMRGILESIEDRLA